jgi:NAD+ synthase (glutamine-hydrolysing)
MRVTSREKDTARRGPADRRAERQAVTFASLGFVRVATIAPDVRVADVEHNTQAIIAALEEAAARGCALALFPELGITGYTCADLFYQSLLRAQARAALTAIAAASARLGIAADDGLPCEAAGKLYTGAAFLAGGDLLGVVP